MCLSCVYRSQPAQHLLSPHEVSQSPKCHDEHKEKKRRITFENINILKKEKDFAQDLLALQNITY